MGRGGGGNAPKALVEASAARSSQEFEAKAPYAEGYRHERPANRLDAHPTGNLRQACETCSPIAARLLGRPPALSQHGYGPDCRPPVPSPRRADANASTKAKRRLASLSVAGEPHTTKRGEVGGTWRGEARLGQRLPSHDEVRAHVGCVHSSECAPWRWPNAASRGPEPAGLARLQP